MKPTVADHIAAFLVDRGVEQVFGLCGHTNISVLAAFERHGAPRFITTRHEQVAAHAADGYARATGRPGVVLLHVGPGMTNATTGVATAAFDSIPMLVIAGDVPSYLRGPRSAPGVQRCAVTPTRCRSTSHSSSEPGGSVGRTRCRGSSRGPGTRRSPVGPDPVLVSVPMDILAEVLDAAVVPASPVARPTISVGHGRRRSPTSCARAARPLLLAGGGTRRAAGRGPATSRSAAGLPVVHTLMGTGVLPPDHPQLLGMIGFWGSPTANRLASEADVILAVGTRFPETDSSSWEPGVTFRIPPTRLIHVDIDPHEPGRNYPAAIAATADAALALRADRRRLRGRDARPRLRLGRAPATSARRSSRRAAPTRTSDEFPLLPERILADCPARRPRRDPRHRCRLEQERRRPAVPGRRPGLVPHARRLLDDGLRSGGGPRRGRGRAPADRRSPSSATAPSARTRASSRPPSRWGSRRSGS